MLCAHFWLLNQLESPPPRHVVFFNECEASKISTISTLTHISRVFCRNWPPYHQITSPFFCNFTRLPRAHSLENFDGVQRCSKLLHQDGLYHHVCWIFICIDFDQINNHFHCNPLSYLMISHINVLYPLVIHVILSEIYRTLIVTVDLNWIMYDFKCADQSS